MASQKFIELVGELLITEIKTLPPEQQESAVNDIVYQLTFIAPYPRSSGWVQWQAKMPIIGGSNDTP